MHSFIRALAFFGCAPFLGFAQPAINAVVNGASYEPGLAPGALVSIFGTGFADSTQYAATLPLPIQLGQTSVQIDGRDAPLYFASPLQINAQVPFETRSSRPNVVVTVAGRTSNAFATSLAPANPGFFTRTQDGKGTPLMFDGGFNSADSVRPGDVVIMYVTGLGATNPAGVTGAGGALSEPLQRSIIEPEIYIGERRADLLYAGLAPGFAGVYQLNVRVPASAASDRLFLRTPGAQSNIVRVAAPSSAQPACLNPTGTIDVLTPVNPVSYSPVFFAGQFSVSCQVAQTGTSTISAVGDAGISIITLHPESGSFEGRTSVPTAAAGSGDFSAGSMQVVDFMNDGIPMPMNIVPASRMNVDVYQALRLLPSPTDYVSGSPNAWWVFTATVQPGSTFVIDCAHHADISRFGAFLPMFWPQPFSTRKAAFTLYVDGVPIASKEATYSIKRQ